MNLLEILWLEVAMLHDEVYARPETRSGPLSAQGLFWLLAGVAWAWNGNGCAPTEEVAASPTPTGHVLEVSAMEGLEAREGEPYEITLPVSGGRPPYRLEVVDGELPWGLRLDPETGVLAGTPSYPGAFAFTVRAQDADGREDRATVSVSVLPWNPPEPIACGSEVTVTLSRSAVDEWGGYRFDASDRVAFYSLDLSGAELTSVTLTATSPDGDPALFLGRRSEPPGSEREGYYTVASTRPGDEEVRLHAASSPSLSYYTSWGGPVAVALAATHPGRMTLRVTCGTGAVLVSSSLPNAVPGVPYQAELEVVSASGVYQVGARSALPEGLTLSSEGVIAGTVWFSGIWDLDVAVWDEHGEGETRTLSLWAPDPLVLECGDTRAITFERAALGLPEGLAAQGGAVFFGVQVPEGVSEIAVDAARDGASSGVPGVGLYLARPGVFAGSSEWQDYEQAAFDAPDLPARLEVGPHGPPGLTAYGGTLAGVVAAQGGAGDAEVSVQCREDLAVATPYLPNGMVGAPYTVQLEAAGGHGESTWFLEAPVPEDMHLSTDGLLEADFAGSGAVEFTVGVQDEAGGVATRRYRIEVGEAAGTSGCGLATAITCDEFVSGSLQVSAWVTRVEVDLSEPGGAAFFCVTVPRDTGTIQLELSNYSGDADLFVGGPGVPPGFVDVSFYEAASSNQGDDEVLLEGEGASALVDWDGILAVAVAAWEPGDFLLYVGCDEAW